MDQSKTIQTADGARLAAWIDGPAGAPAVIFSHYLGGSAAGWRTQADALADRFRVIRYDTRGHGASDATPGPYSVELLASDALAVMAAFDLPRVHFVGLSQGGMTGMWLAAHRPETIDRLVLANTTPFIPNKPIWDELSAKALAEGMDQIARQTIGGWLSEDFKQREPGKTEALIGVMRRMSPIGYAGACAVLRDVDLRGDLAAITAPTLAIGGAVDGPRGAGVTAIAAAVPGSRLTIIDHAAHLSHLENPDAFAAALAEHLA